MLNDDIAAEDVPSVAQNLNRFNGGSVVHIYQYALKGFSIRNLPETSAILLSRDSVVEFVEQDSELLPATSQLNPPSWGLDRIDQASLPVDNSYTYSRTGAGINVYIIDSGIRYTHQTFGGRAFLGTDLVGDGQNGNDCNGHGTHVSGIIGGDLYGVAKSPTFYSVRIFPCIGGTDFATGTAAVDWVTDHHIKPAVVNMSLSGAGNDSFDKAIRKSIAAGVVYVVAAGNDNIDAGNKSPARITQLMTVGATGDHASPYISDSRTLPSGPLFGSNFGSVLDLFAPGTGITSAWYTSDTATQVLEGTSQATPHVAGAAAQYLESDPTACPSTVNDVLTNTATSGVVLNEGTGSPNKLLFITQGWPGATYYSLSLNGINSYVDVADAGLGVKLNITGSITLEAWIKPSTILEQTIVRKGGINDGGYALKLMGNGKVRFITYASPTSQENITSNTTIGTGSWHHVAATFDGTQKRLFIDGVLDKSVASAFAAGSGTGHLTIGAAPDATQFFSGLIDEVRVSADAVYTDSFNHLAFKHLTGVAGTRGLWRFDRQNAKDCADINNGALVGGSTFSSDVP